LSLSSRLATAISGHWGDFRSRWKALLISLALGLVGALIFVELRIPLPYVIGPMFANMVTALTFPRVALWVPAWLKLASLMVIGALFGMTVTPDLIHHIPQWWPTMLLIVLFVVLAVASVTLFMRAMGYDIVTSYFSSTPGGMIAAIAMSSDYRADVRTVTLTQSIRMIVTVITIPSAFRLFADYHPSDAVAVALKATNVELRDVLIGIAASIGGYYAGKLIRVPSPHMFGPMIGVAAVNLTGFLHLTFPDPLVAVAQVIIGAEVGASFAGLRVRAVARGLFTGVAAGFIMLGVGVACALIAHGVTGLPSTQLILAFAPGGFAEMALVAFGLGADLTFVIFHQLVRYILVMIATPTMVAVLRRSGALPPLPKN
jgi:membrane AbrB-like protein